jgi:hypothetical protein
MTKQKSNTTEVEDIVKPAGKDNIIILIHSALLCVITQLSKYSTT